MNGAGPVARGVVAGGKFSCVVDAQARFHLDVQRWYASLAHVVGVEPRDLVVNVVGSFDSDALTTLKTRGVEVRQIHPFDARSPHCNKIAGALSLASEGCRGLCVLTDADTLFFEDPRQLDLKPRTVGMVPVNMANPPVAVLEAVFAAAGLKPSRRIPIPLQPEEWTLAGNGNGGLYIIPGEMLGAVAHAWARWATWLLGRLELLGAWSFFADQVAMAMALASEQIETVEMDVRWNLPVHVPALIPADPLVPAMIHYHQQVDATGRVLPTGHPEIYRRIRDANAALDQLWSEAFPNATFWQWRYVTHPDLGSGIGSRGRPLLDKRALLSAVIDLLSPASVLDVGCGDGEATRGLPIPSYLGLDLSPEAVRLAREHRPEGEFRIGTLTDESLRAELTICLDVLIHQADGEKYQDLVRRLLTSATRALLVSGFDHPVQPASSMVHFHEPLSESLRRWSPSAEVYSLREEHDVTTFLVVKATAECPARDVAAGLLPGAVRGLLRQAAVVRELELQRAASRGADLRELALERLAAEKRELEELRDGLYAELANWRDRVAAIESTRAFRLRGWLLRLRGR